MQNRASKETGDSKTLTSKQKAKENKVDMRMKESLKKPIFRKALPFFIRVLQAMTIVKP